MTVNLKIGDIETLEHTVKENETADAICSGEMPVFSTPMLVLLIEHTAFNMTKRAGHETVGTVVNISHCKACPPGTVLISTAELAEINDRRLVFKVCVKEKDGGAVVGEGLHERFIIDPERFLAKLKKSR